MTWISVKERLPKEYEHVLLFWPHEAGYRPVREGYLSRMAYNDATGKNFDLPLFSDATEQVGDEGWHDEQTVTHWMPLPEPPVDRRA